MYMLCFYGQVVRRSLSKRKIVGSNPTGSFISMTHGDRACLDEMEQVAQEIEEIMEDVSDRHGLVHIGDRRHARHYIAPPKEVVWISYSVMNWHRYIRIRVRWLYIGFINTFIIHVNM
jgi:hypothetical protein